MVFRETPKCPFCGAEIAFAVHEDKGIIGDSFVKWEFMQHMCDEKSKAVKKLTKSQRKAIRQIFKVINKKIKKNKL